jgi:hypothetical protein
MPPSWSVPLLVRREKMGRPDGYVVPQPGTLAASLVEQVGLDIQERHVSEKVVD